MATIRSYRDLEVWEQGMSLVENVYQLTSWFPLGERFGLVTQVRRAAVSVPSNIAAGHTRRHLNEYLQHLYIALTPLAGVATQIEIAFRLSYIAREDMTETHRQTSSLGRKLYALRNSLRASANP